MLASIFFSNIPNAWTLNPVEPTEHETSANGTDAQLPPAFEAEGRSVRQGFYRVWGFRV